MGKAKTTIELNGKVYDPKSGKEIGGDMRPPAIDGVRKTKPSRPTPAHLKKSVQKSKTLMRAGLKAPVPSVVDPTAEFSKRIAKAKAVRQSRLIRKFSYGSPPANPIILPTVAEPPAAEKPAPASRPDFAAAIEGATSHLQKPPKHPGRKLKFKPKKKHIGLSSAAALLLSGFFAWQYVPSLQMRVAATRAGFSASLPSYKPSGYSEVKGIQTEPGKVTISYKSQVDGKVFSITQQPSQWTSETLYVNYILANNYSPRTYQDNGKTVYLLGDSGATWVSGGIWYLIEGESSLTSDQLLRIVGSL